MKKQKHRLLFKYDATLGDKSFKAGSVHELELDETNLRRLTRQGCIFAPKKAELTRKEIKPVKPQVKVKPEKEEIKHVDYKASEKPAKVQADKSDEK